MAKRRRRPVQKFNRKMRTKLLVLFTVIMAGLCGMIGRLMYIEYTSGDKYEKKVLSMQSYDSKTIPYQRGDIVDSTGTVLATSVAVYNVILDCSQMTYKEEYIKPTIDALVECFPELKREDLEAYAKDKRIINILYWPRNFRMKKFRNLLRCRMLWMTRKRKLIQTSKVSGLKGISKNLSI